MFRDEKVGSALAKAFRFCLQVLLRSWQGKILSMQKFLHQNYKKAYGQSNWNYNSRKILKFRAKSSFFLIKTAERFNGFPTSTSGIEVLTMEPFRGVDYLKFNARPILPLKTEKL